MPRKSIKAAICLLGACLLATPLSTFARDNQYAWQTETAANDSITSRFPPPSGYERSQELPGSFADWLRHLPLKEKGAPVRLYNGLLKGNTQAYCAVVNIDTGDRDLQQCADAVIRLRAEYLFSRQSFNAIRFNFTSGDPAEYIRWREGFRPVVNGNKVTWRDAARHDNSYRGFRGYLDSVFTYAGTWSLSRQMCHRKSPSDLGIGDVFIKGGFPGHAVIVVDLAVNRDNGDKIFLLAQSYMPAQDIHILSNPLNDDGSPWYSLPARGQLHTPEWDFKLSELMTFGDDDLTRVSSLKP